MCTNLIFMCCSSQAGVLSKILKLFKMIFSLEMAFECALSLLFLADGHRVCSKASFVSPALVRVSIREGEESRLPSEFLWRPNMTKNERMAAWVTLFLLTRSMFWGSYFKVSRHLPLLSVCFYQLHREPSSELPGRHSASVLERNCIY